MRQEISTKADHFMLMRSICVILYILVTKIMGILIIPTAIFHIKRTLTKQGRRARAVEML